MDIELQFYTPANKVQGGGRYIGICLSVCLVFPDSCPVRNFYSFLWHWHTVVTWVYHRVCLFVCLFGVFCSTRYFFTHLETSPLPVRGCKFWPMLGTHDHWAVSVRYNGHLRGTMTLTPIAERLAVELSIPVLTTYRSVAA